MKKYLTLIIYLLIIVTCFILYKTETKNKNTNLTKVTVAEVTHSIFYAPQYVAIENNYFKEEGLEIELLLTPGADNVTAAVLSKDADIGLCGSEATIYVYNSKEKDYLKTFAQLTQKDGSFIVSRKNIKNFKLSDLKGKKIIGGRIGGMPEMTLEYILKENNIDPNKDLEIDTSISFANMASSFIGGNGDFVALFEPTATEVVKQGYGYKVASLGSLGGNVPYTAYNARTSYIKNNKDIIEKFTKAINKGLEYVNNNTSKNIAKLIKNQFPDTNLNDLISAIDSYKNNNTWPKESKLKEKDFNHLQDIIIEANMLDKKVKYANLVYER